MIPKKIHYCWFGKKELPAKAVRCINSWKKYCPDYEIIEWNEDNYDVYQNPYTAYAYDNKKFAFLSDYARLQIVLKEGGLYFDVDVEIVRPLDELLDHKAFFGFETEEYVNTGLGFGAEANNTIVACMLREYDQLLDGTHGTIGCPILNTTAKRLWIDSIHYVSENLIARNKHFIGESPKKGLTILAIIPGIGLYFVTKRKAVQQ